MKITQGRRALRVRIPAGPSFFNEAPWRIRVEPRGADWDEPHGLEHLG
jgi:hypothetical protein